MHPLTCVKYGAAALALGPAQSVKVPRGAASEYRICVIIMAWLYMYTYAYLYCEYTHEEGKQE